MRRLTQTRSTEPEEALLLGGNTATLWNGRVTQFGAAMDVYRHPVNMTTALIYSDPPMNFVNVQKTGSVIQFPNGQTTKAVDRLASAPDGKYRAGFRAHHLEMDQRLAAAITFEATLIVTELTGSDTFIHLATLDERWIGLLPRPQAFDVGQVLTVSVNPRNIYYFEEAGALIQSPEHIPGEPGA